MSDTELIGLIEKHEIRIVRRPGAGGGWQWVAYNGSATCADPDLRTAVIGCVVAS